MTEPYQSPEPGARAAWEADLPITLTASAETAARMAEKQVIGLSIREEPVPAPVPATAHVMFHESKTHPGVVWPL